MLLIHTSEASQPPYNAACIKDIALEGREEKAQRENCTRVFRG